MHFPDLEVCVGLSASFAGDPATTDSVLLPERPHLGALVGQNRTVHVRQGGSDPHVQGKDSHEKGETRPATRSELIYHVAGMVDIY